MSNKDRYVDILAKCQTAIETVRLSEHTIVAEQNKDVQENMYDLSINTLKYLLEVCFDDEDSINRAWEQLEIEIDLDEIDLICTPR